jgi:hypothetical protein
MAPMNLVEQIRALAREDPLRENAGGALDAPAGGPDGGLQRGHAHGEPLGRVVRGERQRRQQRRARARRRRRRRA